VMTDIASKQTRHMGLPLNSMNRYSDFLFLKLSSRLFFFFFLLLNKNDVRA
jgi:hypothetical protein